LATLNRHWVAAKLVERPLATPKRRWVGAKPVERPLTPFVFLVTVLSTFKRIKVTLVSWWENALHGKR
jgi:hypothetical protein